MKNNIDEDIKRQVENVVDYYKNTDNLEEIPIDILRAMYKDNLSELETQINNTHILQSQLDVANAEKIEWKKIAEFLAEEISYTDNHICKYFDAINECKYEARKDNTNTCKQCIIDWARKEVEKDDN